jgi:hypothetical protein
MREKLDEMSRTPITTHHLDYDTDFALPDLNAAMQAFKKGMSQTDPNHDISKLQQPAQLRQPPSPNSSMSHSVHPKIEVVRKTCRFNQPRATLLKTSSDPTPDQEGTIQSTTMISDTTSWTILSPHPSPKAPGNSSLEASPAVKASPERGTKFIKKRGKAPPATLRTPSKRTMGEKSPLLTYSDTDTSNRISQRNSCTPIP